MYSFFYDVFFILKRRERKICNKQSYQAKTIKWLLGYIEAYYNLLVIKLYDKFPSKRIGVKKNKREQRIIVSLTTFPKRVNTVWITIETLLRQTVKPDEVILWLAKSQFDDISVLPQKLVNLQKRGLTIRFCDELRSHKKYFYVMQEYPEDIIVLADDDMFYPSDTLRKLIKMHKKYPKDICTMTSQVIEPSFETKPSMWRNPKLGERFVHSEKVQIFTGSGSLYPPGSLDKTAFRKDLIKDLCPYADDLWLTFMANRKGTKITSWFPWRAFPITIYGTSEETLWHINAADGKNDDQWEAMLNYFKE